MRSTAPEEALTHRQVGGVSGYLQVTAPPPLVANKVYHKAVVWAAAVLAAAV